MVLCQSHSYAKGREPSGLVIRGYAYFLFNILIVCAAVASFTRSLRHLRKQTGIRRIELQFIVFSLGSLLVLVPTLNAAGNLLNLRLLNRASIVVILICYAVTAWGIAVHRVFDARQVFFGIAQRAFLALALTLGILGAWRLGDTMMPPEAGLFVAVLGFTPIAFWLDGQTRRWLGLSDEAVLRELRDATIKLSGLEPDPEALATRFKALLCERFHGASATFIFDPARSTGGTSLHFATDRPGFADLCATGWATPETLQRRRPSEAIRDLQQFMAEHALGVIVAVPTGSPKPSLIVALGAKPNRWPFTFPEVQRLQRVAEWMNVSLIQARLVAQAALEAKMEHLALMSRGLAHDLKNLLTPVASFIVHTDGQFPEASAEGEVHSAAKRSVRLMTEYVRNSLFFSSRLTPRFEPLDLEKLARAVVEHHESQAVKRNVAITREIDPRLSLTADGALLQRLASNLLGNALDASPPGATVRLRLSESKPGWVRLEVSDHGCGIAPENLARIFEPYFTTKNFGDDGRGFGLGLTVCRKIAELHQGRITVESKSGSGTRMCVDLPATPSAFAPSFDATEFAEPALANPAALA